MLRLIKIYQRLSRSERRLVILTGAALLVAAFYIGTLRALDNLDKLDAQSAALEIELRNFTELEQQAEPINRAFAAMASQHSSQWTQEEIHDRLRIEITRLALRNIPAEGAPITAGGSAGDPLVVIRALPTGSLESTTEGYRTYQISFKTEPTTIQNIAMFLERLQLSNQALRIDSVELTRQANVDAVSAAVRVTRTVIDDVPGGGSATEPASEQVNIARNHSFETWNPDKLTLPEWQQQDCVIMQHPAQATDGTTCLRMEGTQPGGVGALYQQHELVAGATYDLYLDAYAWGPGVIRIVSADGKPFEGEQQIVPDGAPYKYHLRFCVPGEPGKRVAVQAPFVAVQDKGVVVLVDNVRLVEVQA